jgi:hypothetical protein
MSNYLATGIVGAVLVLGENFIFICSCLVAETYSNHITSAGQATTSIPPSLLSPLEMITTDIIKTKISPGKTTASLYFDIQSALTS